MPQDEVQRIARELNVAHIEAAKTEAQAIARACNACHSLDALDFPTLCILTAILYATRRPS